MLNYFFFFSSRRRHTRLTCDWSSDVCSSDLTGSASEILLQLLAERGLLPRVERYLITEPNAYFRRCSQRKLAGRYPNLALEWAPLDLDLPWNTQGITAGEFDLVYAVNVMHISKNLLFSLNEARSALATDGWLVIG